MNSISDKIKNRIILHGGKFKCNDNISEFIEPGEHGLLMMEVEAKVEELLQTLIIDTETDHNTHDTPRRVAKMFVDEIFSGRYYDAPSVTEFPNVSKYDNLYVVGPITIRSMCAHHFMPIIGSAFVGVYPGTEVIGLSKFNRLIDWVASRPQIQEEMTCHIANIIEHAVDADGVAVMLKANHFCMTHRGVKEHESDMITSVMRGKFLEDKSLKQEFYDIVRMK